MALKRSTWFLSMAVVVIFLALQAPTLFSYVYGNVGIALLSRALNDESDEPPVQEIARAKSLLRRSTAYASENRYAWRGLGFALAEQGCEDEAIDAWQTTKQVANEFIERGTQARKAGEYSEALVWYERGAKVDPELTDAWFHLGLTYEQLEDWKRAGQAYREALLSTSSEKVGLSDAYFRLGQICDQRVATLDRERSLALYDRALKLNDFSSEWARTQTHYARAEALRKLGRKRAAAQEYRWVIAHRASDYWAHIHLGFLVWELDRDAARAEALFGRALDIKDRDKWAYRGLGLVYQKTGRSDAAVEMYRRVLLLDPTDALASEQITKVTGDR